MKLLPEPNVLSTVADIAYKIAISKKATVKQTIRYSAISERGLIDLTSPKSKLSIAKFPTKFYIKNFVPNMALIELSHYFELKIYLSTGFSSFLVTGIFPVRET